MTGIPIAAEPLRAIAIAWAAESYGDMVRWRTKATRAAHLTARTSGMCEEFDRLMCKVGLPPRHDEYEVTVIVPLTFNMGLQHPRDADTYVSADLVSDMLLAQRWRRFEYKVVKVERVRA